MWLQVQLEEYKILQGKIDKIGEFHFKIKEWSITIVLAFVLGTRAFQAPAPYLLILLPVILVLWLLEKQQTVLQRRFGARALLLEQLIRKTLKHASHTQHGDQDAPPVDSPVDMRTASPRIASAVFENRSRHRKPPEPWHRRLLVWVQSHVGGGAFYSMLGLIVILMFALKMLFAGNVSSGESTPEANSVRVIVPKTIRIDFDK